jgi:hypothetical protein
VRLLIRCFIAGCISLSAVAAADPKGEHLKPVKTSLISNWFDLPFCDNDTLSLELPTRYLVTYWRRLDFDLFTVAESRQPGSGAELMIYIGHAPNERHPDEADRTEGHIGGQATDWYSWSEQRDGRSVYFFETVVDLFPVRPSDPPLVPGKAPPPLSPPPSKFVCREGISVHLLARGPSRDTAKRVVALASSLRAKQTPSGVK